VRFSSLVHRISGPTARAWDVHYRALAAQRLGSDVIILSVGDPGFATPAPARARALRAMEAGDTHYTEILGRPALREAVARDYRAHGGHSVGAEHVAILAGAQNALFVSALCLLEAGDEVLVPEPMYLTYPAALGTAGARLVAVATPASNGFRLDLEALAAAVTPRTRAIFYATPNNPTGVAFTRTELEGIAALARQHDLWVVADEVYARFCFERKHESLAALPGMAERVITVSSVSKSHAMTGWRCGWMIAPTSVIEHVGNLGLCMLYGLPGFIQEGALEAITHCDAAVEDMRAAYRRRRDWAIDCLDAVPGLRCLTPEAGLFMLFDVRATGLTAAEFATRLYEETGVAALDATAFGPSAEGHVRLSFSVDDAVLAEGCRRIAAFARRAMAENLERTGAHGAEQLG
jgi:arginine:pyruvate transaminase